MHIHAFLKMCCFQPRLVNTGNRFALCGVACLSGLIIRFVLDILQTPIFFTTTKHLLILNRLVQWPAVSKEQYRLFIPKPADRVFRSVQQG